MSQGPCCAPDQVPVLPPTLLHVLICQPAQGQMHTYTLHDRSHLIVLPLRIPVRDTLSHASRPPLLLILLLSSSATSILRAPVASAQFMDASRPGAILVYSGIYVGHWIFLGVLALLFEGKRRLLGVIKSSEAYKAH